MSDETYDPDAVPGRVDLTLGDDHFAEFYGWYPDRNLNPQYAAFPDADRIGVIYYHKRPDNGKWCSGAIMFSTAPAPLTGLRWTLESLDPLTVSPSLLCQRCGDHGFIRNGKWVRA